MRARTRTSSTTDPILPIDPTPAATPRTRHREGRSHRVVVGIGVAVAVAALVAGCSKDEAAAPPATSPVTGTAVSGTTIVDIDPAARLAQAKTVAVGFFEAQAVNDSAKALERSSGAAALTIKWAQSVNTLKAANGSGYQVPSSTAPNTRVQFDSLDKLDDGRYRANGFVELSFRPGPVVATTTTTAPTKPGTTLVTPGSPNGTYVVDLVFSGDGDALRLDDYRLDDTPYPVSELYTAPNADAQSPVMGGTLTLAHRDLDGSVQYFAEVDNKTAGSVDAGEATFVPKDTTTKVPAGGLVTKVFADPVPTNTRGGMLVVLPGAYPGSAGTLTVTFAAGATTTGGSVPAGSVPSGSVVPLVVAFDAPEPPPLTPRPINTVTTSGSTTTTSSTSSTSSSTTTSTTRGSTTSSSPSSSTTPSPSSSTTAMTTTTAPVTTSTSSTTSTLPVTVP